MVSEEELDKFVEDDLYKDINQSSSIDPSVEQHMQEMGWIWDKVQKKLQEDNTCFKCKKQIKDSQEDTEHLSYLLQASSTEKGVVAFVSLCSSCQLESEVEKNGKEE